MENYPQIFVLILIKNESIEDLEILASSKTFVTIYEIYNNLVNYTKRNSFKMTIDDEYNEYRFEIQGMYYVGINYLNLNDNFYNLKAWFWYEKIAGSLSLKLSIISDVSYDSDVHFDQYEEPSLFCKTILDCRRYTAINWEMHKRKEKMLTHLLSTRYAHGFYTDKYTTKCSQCKYEIKPQTTHLRILNNDCTLFYCDDCSKPAERRLYDLATHDTNELLTDLGCVPQLNNVTGYLQNPHFTQNSFFGLKEHCIKFMYNTTSAMFIVIHNNLETYKMRGVLFEKTNGYSRFY